MSAPSIYSFQLEPDGLAASGKLTVGAASVDVCAKALRPWLAKVEVAYFGKREALIGTGAAPDWLFEDSRSGKGRSGFRKDESGNRISKSRCRREGRRLSSGDYRVTRTRPPELAGELPGVDQAVIDILWKRREAIEATHWRTAEPELTDREHEIAMAQGFADGSIAEYVRSPGVEDSAALGLMREFLQLAESRSGAYALMMELRREPLPFVVAKLRALRPWRPQLTLVVNNA